MGSRPKVFTEKYLPEAFPLSDPSKADIKLGQLLSMSSGMHGEGGNPGIVNGIDQKLDPMPRPDAPQDQDTSALRAPMWTKPGEGYFLLLGISPRGLDRSPPPGGDGDAAVHRREAG